MNLHDYRENGRFDNLMLKEKRKLKPSYDKCFTIIFHKITFFSYLILV